jgi:hypothetical protein
MADVKPALKPKANTNKHPKHIRIVVYPNGQLHFDSHDALPEKKLKKFGDAWMKNSWCG